MTIEAQIKRQVATKLRRAAFSVLPQINRHIAQAYQNQEFVQSLRVGLLKADFGLTESKSSSITEGIIAELTANTKAEFVPGTGNILGILRVTLKTGLSDSLFNQAEYKSRGKNIPWLSWLLKRGTEVVISDYEVDYTNSPKSRSGLALMKEEKGGIFRVDPKYAGTDSDNVITRFLASEVRPLQQIMLQQIKKEFK